MVLDTVRIITQQKKRGEDNLTGDEVNKNKYL